MGVRPSTLAAILAGASPVFSPASMFAAGEQGGWYDPSDFSTLFQDAAGTVPVTAVGQTVKRINDKSGRGNHLSNASAAWTLQQDATGAYYLLTDGTTRLQAAASIAWGAGAVSILAGLQPATAGQTKAIVGFGNVASTTATWSFEAQSGGFLQYRRGSGAFGGRSVPSVGTSKSVITSCVDLTGATHDTENKCLRVNGVQPTRSNFGTADTGTGNFGTSAFSIGGGGNFWSGRIYFLLVSAKVLADADIAAAETFVGAKTGRAVPLIAADSPVWLDTAAPTTEAWGQRVNPFARAKYTTTAEDISVNGYTDIALAFTGMDQIVVLVNGAYSSNINPTANGAFSANLQLAAGSKTVEFVCGMQSSPSHPTIIGSWFVSASASAAMTAVSETPTDRLVIYGDSIAVGANGAVPPKDGWALQVRAARTGKSTVVEGYGYRSLWSDAADSTARAAFVARILALSPAKLWMAIGTNDYGLTRWTATAFGTAYAAVLDDLHAAMPSLVIYCQTPILRSSEPTTNGNGLFLSDFRAAIVSAVSPRSAWATLVDGTTLLTTGDLDDGVHPSTAGHGVYAAAVLSAYPSL